MNSEPLRGNTTVGGTWESLTFGNRPPSSQEIGSVSPTVCSVPGNVYLTVVWAGQTSSFRPVWSATRSFGAPVMLSAVKTGSKI